jgi:hypothetical protein
VGLTGGEVVLSMFQPGEVVEQIGKSGIAWADFGDHQVQRLAIVLLRIGEAAGVFEDDTETIVCSHPEMGVRRAKPLSNGQCCAAVFLGVGVAPQKAETFAEAFQYHDA